MCLEDSIDDVHSQGGRRLRLCLQSWGDVKNGIQAILFGYRLGNLIAGNNWRKIEYDVT